MMSHIYRESQAQNSSAMFTRLWNVDLIFFLISLKIDWKTSLSINYSIPVYGAHNSSSLRVPFSEIRQDNALLMRHDNTNPL